MKSVSILETLIVRDWNDDVSMEILKFEKRTSIQLPPIYKVFYRTYQIPTFSNEMYIDSNADLGMVEVERMCKFLPKPNFFPPLQDIFELEAVRSALENYKNDGTYDPNTESSLADKKLIPIMKFDNAMLVTVSYSSENLDKIYLYNTDMDEGEGRFLFLGNDVFHFLRCFSVFDDPDEKDLYGRLYRNWNDDFWMLRDKHTFG